MKTKYLRSPLLCGIAALAAFTAPAAAQSDGETLRLSLDEAINLAFTRGSDIEGAKRMMEQSRLQVANAKSAYLPNASVTIGVNQSAGGSISRSNDFTFRSGISGNFVGTLSANVSMPIDISGAIGRNVQSARLQHDASSIQSERIQRDALVNVQIAYLTALQAQQKVKIDESIVQSLAELKKQAQKRFASIIPFLDVELASAREEARSSRAGFEQAQDSLKLALELPFAVNIELTDEVPDPKTLPPLGANEVNLDKNLDILAAGKQLESAELAIEQAKDYRRPSLNVGASASQTFSGRFVDDAGQSRSRAYGLNVALNVPIFNFDAGRSDNSVRSSELRLEQTRADIRQARQLAELNVRQSRKAVERAAKRLEELPDPNAAAQALGNAINALLNASPETAPATIAQISNARSTWRYAQYAVIDARIDAVIAVLRLSRTVGEPIRLRTAHS